MFLKEFLSKLKENLKPESDLLIEIDSNFLRVRYPVNFKNMEEAYEKINNLFADVGFPIENLVFPQVIYKQRNYVMEEYDIDLSLHFFTIYFKLINQINPKNILEIEFDDDILEDGNNSLDQAVAAFLKVNAYKNINDILYSIVEIKKLKFNEFGQVISEHDDYTFNRALNQLTKISAIELNTFFKKQGWKDSGNSKEHKLLYYPWDLEHIFYYPSEVEGYKLTINFYDPETEETKTLTPKNYEDLDIPIYKQFDTDVEQIFYIDKIIGIQIKDSKEQKIDITKAIFKTLNITGEKNKELLKENKVTYKYFGKIIAELDKEVLKRRYKDFSISFNLLQNNIRVQLDDRSKNNLIQQIRKTNSDEVFF